MIVRPYGVDDWYRIPAAKKDPDDEALYFGRSGEFGPWGDKAFNKHLIRLEKLNKYFANLNGNRIRAILKEERLLYSTRGMEEVIYK